jgi:hypothetical protein
MALLLIIQPSELFVFPFTTGLLGLAIGIAIICLKKRVLVVLASALVLLFGILSVLYGLKFPLLGPGVSSSFTLGTVGWIFLFSFFYSWLWVDGALLLLKRLNKVLPNRHLETAAKIEKG